MRSLKTFLIIISLWSIGYLYADCEALDFTKTFSIIIKDRISSVSCDNENIFVFSQNSGKVCNLLFSGEKEKHAFSNSNLKRYLILKVNKFTNNLFFIKNDGFVLKEFDKKGKLLNSYEFMKQKGIYFDFLDENKVVLINLPEPPYEKGKKYKNFCLYDLKSRKIITEFGTTDCPYQLNDKQHFIIFNKKLYTMNLQNMNILVYDLKTSKLINRMAFLRKYRKNRVIRKKVAEGLWISETLIFNRIKFFIEKKKLYFVLIKSRDGRDKVDDIIFYKIEGNKVSFLFEKKGFNFGEPADYCKNILLFFKNTGKQGFLFEFRFSFGGK